MAEVTIPDILIYEQNKIRWPENSPKMNGTGQYATNSLNYMQAVDYMIQEKKSIDSLNLQPVC